ncbi:VOC family protein [Chelativorans salis]|uniref:VOC family protein n=1 Tax=Chelativorans salis TaxID=2978478 RepID=A0ABT2LJ12_9HYPH|nr:VOC family protein [Chelativorans sp. EGI FJ00035]MCT7374236.1 VOC family protein [Chelativorans sp. EGI FJ00035]
MIGYVTLGTNELERSATFYDKLLFEMGAERAYRTGSLVAWRFENGPLFVLSMPYDRAAATAGNGTIVALSVDDTAVVDRLHALALRLGASDEGAPGPRGKSFYGAYFRGSGRQQAELALLFLKVAAQASLHGTGVRHSRSTGLADRLEMACGATGT